MRKLSVVALLLAVVFVASGCVASFNPLVGVIYSDDVAGPVAVTSNNGPGPKVGTATSTLIFGISQGDASVQAAAANGDIKKIYTVDTKVKNVLGVFCEATTIVTGE